MNPLFSICLFAFLLFSCAVLLIFRPSLGRIRLGTKKRTPTLRDDVRLARGERKDPAVFRLYRSLGAELRRQGRGRLYTLLPPAMVLTGILVSVPFLFLGFPLLVPPLFFCGAALPFGLCRAYAGTLLKKEREELESAMQILTVSYLRSQDLEQAIGETLRVLSEGPVKEAFSTCLGEIRSVRPDAVLALKRLRDAFDDQVFTDWCTALIECQRDRAFLDTLPPLVSKLGEERQVNVEVRGILRSARTEFLLMALMLAGNLPLLYLLNRDWFAALTQSPYGHLVMGLGALVVAVGALLVQHWTRPVRYREKGKGGLL